MGLLHLKHELKVANYSISQVLMKRSQRPVLPGDQMEFNVQVIKERRGITGIHALLQP